MKKLMLLGGSRYLLPVIEKAHKLGLYVITCDYLPDNIAHKYSDEYLNISIIEKDAVLVAAQNASIDGIMSFACDPGVVTAAYVAEKMGLPFCGSYEAVSILQNKGKFRAFLKENGFNVPEHGSYATEAEALLELERFSFPVIVKPVDSAGSKGVMRADSVEELKKAIAFALEYTHIGRFIIEEFIEKKGCSSDSDSFSDNGIFTYISFSDQRFDVNAKNPYTPAAYSWPPTMDEEMQVVLRNELQRLADLLELKTSIYNIETRVGTNGKPYIMEVSPRGGGNRLAEMLEYASDTDIISNAILAAVGEPYQTLNHPIYNGYWAEVILHSEKNGQFVSLEIDEIIKNNVKEIDLWVKLGDFVDEFNGANNAIGTLVLRFSDKVKLEQTILNIYDYIKVIVE
ncbi:MAG: ATP-grasp domain-containing protein [Clostridia bacterium]|nr:ATP-grasp domain-containing protein [Clostridia bacterium]